MPFSSHADRPAAVHRKCYGQQQGCRSTSLAGSAPGLSNKATSFSSFSSSSSSSASASSSSILQPPDRPAAVHRKCYGQQQGCRSTSIATSSSSSSSSSASSSSACHSPATQIDLRPSTGSATVSTRAAAAQALLAQHLGCPTRTPQTAASLLAQQEQRHCYFVFFLIFFFFCFFFFCLPFSSHADRPAAVHRKCYGQHQGCRSTSLAGSAPGLSNKAPANSRQSISTARTEALLLCFLLPVASGFSDLVMLLGLLLSAAAVIAVVGVYPGVAGHNLGIGISTFVGFSTGHS